MHDNLTDVERLRLRAQKVLTPSGCINPHNTATRVHISNAMIRTAREAVIVKGALRLGIEPVLRECPYKSQKKRRVWFKIALDLYRISFLPSASYEEVDDLIDMYKL